MIKSKKQEMFERIADVLSDIFCGQCDDIDWERRMPGK